MATRTVPAANKAGALAVVIGVLALGGCATFSGDGGFGVVERAARDRLGKDARWQRDDGDEENIRAAVRRLLESPLSADNAVQIALLNNRGLQATYAELGLAEADLVRAGRMTNPHFAYLHTQHGGERKIEWSLAFPVIDLLTMPLRTRIEKRRFEQVKLAVTGQMLDVAAETRKSWFRAVASVEFARYREQVKTAAETGAELSRRMAAVGNVSWLDQMREQVFYAEAVAQLAQARHDATAERERLARLLGLHGEDVRFQLPERLPELPADKADLRDLEARAIAQRVDVLAAKRDAESLAGSLGLAKATRFINVLEFGPAAVKEEPEPWKRGFELSLELPLFDWGSARVAKAEAIYMRAVHRVAEAAVIARSEVREAYSSYHTAYDTAKHYRDEIVPLRKKIAEENLLRYNGMLISVFELLADAREQVASVTAYVGALRDFWLAESDLQASLNGASTARRDCAPKASVGRIPAAAPAGH